MWKKKSQVEQDRKLILQSLSAFDKRFERIEKVLANIIKWLGTMEKDGTVTDGAMKDLENLKSALNFLNINLGYMAVAGQQVIIPKLGEPTNIFPKLTKIDPKTKEPFKPEVKSDAKTN